MARRVRAGQRHDEVHDTMKDRRGFQHLYGLGPQTDNWQRAEAAKVQRNIAARRRGEEVL